MVNRILKTLFFVVADIAVGIALAKFKVQDYLHASISIKEGQTARPLYINDHEGRQVLAP